MTCIFSRVRSRILYTSTGYPYRPWQATATRSKYLKSTSIEISVHFSNFSFVTIKLVRILVDQILGSRLKIPYQLPCLPNASSTMRQMLVPGFASHNIMTSWPWGGEWFQLSVTGRHVSDKRPINGYLTTTASRHAESDNLGEMNPGSYAKHSAVSTACLAAVCSKHYSHPYFSRRPPTPVKPQQIAVSMGSITATRYSKLATSPSPI